MVGYKGPQHHSPNTGEDCPMALSRAINVSRQQPLQQVLVDWQ
jgi:hypothetical protein